MKQSFFTIIRPILVCIFFGGCRTKYIPVPVESTDSIVIRDTIIDVQLVPYSDSVIVVPEQESKDSVVSFLSNPYAWSWAQWMNGRLHHSLNIWPNRLTPIRVESDVTWVHIDVLEYGQSGNKITYFKG